MRLRVVAFAVGVAVCGRPTPGAGQGAAGAIAGAQRQLRGFLIQCDTTGRLKGMPGGGEFKLSHEDPLRLPYGVRYRFRRRVPGAEHVFLTLEVESRGDLAEPEQTVQAEALPGDAGCFQAMLPPLPQDRAVTLRQTTVARLEAQRSTAIRDALEGLQAEFLRELDAGTFGPAAAHHRLDSAIAAVYPRLVDSSAFAGAALVQVSAGRPTVVPLSDTVRSLFLASAGSTIDVPGIASRGHDLIGQLDAVAAGTTPCVMAALGSDQTAFRALVGRLAPLRAASTAADVAPLYARVGGVLPLSPDDVTRLVRWLDAACRGHINQTALDGLAAVVVDLGRDPLGPLLEALAAARSLVDEMWTITSFDAFGGATTTLQRYGQIDVVNAYLPTRDEARVLVTFSFYPLKRRYGGERLPHDLGDQLVLSVGYSVATTVPDSTSDRRALTAGVMLRFNATLAVGGGVALIDRRTYGYASLSFDIGSIPGLAQLFARPGN